MYTHLRMKAEKELEKIETGKRKHRKGKEETGNAISGHLGRNVGKIPNA